MIIKEQSQCTVVKFEEAMYVLYFFNLVVYKIIVHFQIIVLILYCASRTCTY